MKRPTIGPMCPFFIVGHVGTAIGFYEGRLGFEVRFQEPATDPFFAIVGRDGAMLLLKSGAAGPLPNPRRDPDMRWDAYCHTADPDALTAEFTRRGASFSRPLEDTHEGLRGFEVTDPDGYVIFFGRPG